MRNHAANGVFLPAAPSPSLCQLHRRLCFAAQADRCTQPCHCVGNGDIYDSPSKFGKSRTRMASSIHRSAWRDHRHLSRVFHSANAGSDGQGLQGKVCQRGVVCTENSNMSHGIRERCQPRRHLGHGRLRWATDEQGGTRARAPGVVSTRPRIQVSHLRPLVRRQRNVGDVQRRTRLVCLDGNLRRWQVPLTIKEGK